MRNSQMALLDNIQTIKQPQEKEIQRGYIKKNFSYNLSVVADVTTFQTLQISFYLLHENYFQKHHFL